MKNLQFIDNIIAKEGGYVDSSADRGGKTKFGITQDTWTGYAKGKGLPAAVADITPEMARLFYESYISRMGLDGLDGPLLQFLFDFTAHSGYEAFRQIRKGLPGLLRLLGEDQEPPASWSVNSRAKFSPDEIAYLVSVDGPTLKLALWLVKLSFWWRGVKEWYATHPRGSAARAWRQGDPPLKGVSSPGFHPLHFRGWVNRSLEPLFWEGDLEVTQPVLQALVVAMARMNRTEDSEYMKPLWPSFLRGYPFRDEVLKHVPLA